MAVFVQYDFKFQIANIILAIICQSEDWGSEIFAYITSQDNFWSIFASCIVLRCGISWNMRKLLLQAILWFEAQVVFFFHEFLCSEMLSGRAWADKSDLIVFTTLPWLMMMIDYCWRYRKFSKKRFWRRLGNQVMFGFCHTRFFIAFHQ